MNSFRIALLATLVTATAVYAQATPENVCQALRAKAWAEFVRCELRVQRRYQMAGAAYADGAPDFKGKYSFGVSTCRMKYNGKWNTLTNDPALAGTSCQGPRFVDVGNGTVQDNLSGLVWQKQENIDGVPDYANPRDGDNHYVWSSSMDATAADGTVFSQFLAQMNDVAHGCFAGTCDWRLPTRDEAASGFIDPYTGGDCPHVGCLDAAFSPAQNVRMWTSTPSSLANTDDKLVWYAGSGDGHFNQYCKYPDDDDVLGYGVRAVRRGTP